ncbi:MAG TPA: L-glyceraldehyde 3-phosphate reductase [Ruminococcaceae bacterium]|nr:L-glyceraldehyde 3-phosphate reductase [Oscillospiraceae bacterium]
MFENRYADMNYRRVGDSGLKLPPVTLGLWQNFGGMQPYENSRQMAEYAFSKGITHFDLANNYGPPPGSAEETFGKILRDSLHAYRDELIISTKAGYTMWDGPYGDWGSKKYLTASLDQSLKRMGLEYVDIFYSHRMDPETPLYETMDALACAVRAGKALYAGISNYSPEKTREAAEILKGMGIHCLIHQMRYNMLDRKMEKNGLFDTLRELGIGSIAFSPLAQGVLTNRYLEGIPAGSRAATSFSSIDAGFVTDEKMHKVKKLAEIAAGRGQSITQLALAWVLREKCAASVIIGASRVGQIEENLGALKNLKFTDEELSIIDGILED